MYWRRQKKHIAAVAGIFLSMLVLCQPAFAQQDAPPSFVEIYWQSSKTVPAAGLSSLIILDPDIAKAEVAYDSIQFFGIGRGETVALGYKNGEPVSIRIRVIPRPIIGISPAFLRRQS